ncbi:hypothetical protein PMAYCL1PPCAC_09424, partial [Pristionchus mayeri]
KNKKKTKKPLYKNRSVACPAILAHPKHRSSGKLNVYHFRQVSSTDSLSTVLPLNANRHIYKSILAIDSVRRSLSVMR